MKIIAEPVEPVTKYRKAVPPNVAAAVAKALEKLPADRFETAKAFAEALVNRAFTSATSVGTAVSGLRSPFLGVPFVVAALVAVVTTVAAIAGWMRRLPEPPFRRFDLTLGSVVPLVGMDLAISPDGSMLAVATRDSGIYLRHLDGDPEFRRLAGGDSGLFPAFSPDNQWIVFTRGSDRSLVKISVNGGGAVTLVPGGGPLVPVLPHWGTSDQIVFTTPGGGTFTISATGGKPVPIPKVPSRLTFLLPDGSGILHTLANQVALYHFKGDSTVVLVPGREPLYVASGHILYRAEEGGIFAVPFDLARGKVTGTPVRVLERVGASPNARGYSVSATGTLVQYDASGTMGSASVLLVMVDPGQGVDTVRLPLARRGSPRFSRDGRAVAMEVFPSERNGESDIYTVDLVTGTYTQLTFDGDNDGPVWSPDGKRILFDRVATNPAGEDLFIKPADNSAPERRLTSLGSQEVQAHQWLDDKTLLFGAMVPGRGADVFTMAADSGSVPTPNVQSPFNETDPRISPDRKLLAFTSNEAGSNQIWMRDYPVPQGKWNISRGAGQGSRWSPDGRFVYFWRVGVPLDTLFRVRIDRTPAIVVHAPEVVAALDATGSSNWDLHPDGRRFIVAVIAPAAPSTATQRARYLILENWFGDLRRRTAAMAK